MSLQFVFGNSGSGKSDYLYESVLEQAALHPQQNFLVLVPEQFTMQTQRELVNRQKNHAIMNVDVLSFARLAYRVFDELGRQELVILEETGKNLVLRKVAEQKKKELKVLGGNISRMGYIGEVKSLISELTQYSVTPEELERFLGEKEMGDALRFKLSDILVMYRGFREYMEGTYITAEEVLSLLCDVAGESALIRDSVIVFDEFTGFTPIQNRVLRELLLLAKKVYVSVTIDIRENFYHSRGVHELFALSKKTVEVVQRLAFENGVPVEDPVILSSGEEKRYRNAPELSFMEQNLFRPAHQRRAGEPEGIKVACLRDPREELAYAAGEIARLIRSGQCRYKDIAVVTGDVPQYANYVPEIFETYGIPYFIDQTRTILYHPFIEFIRAALEVVEYDFSAQSVFRFLRSGLAYRIASFAPEEKTATAAEDPGKTATFGDEWTAAGLPEEAAGALGDPGGSAAESGAAQTESADRAATASVDGGTAAGLPDAIGALEEPGKSGAHTENADRAAAGSDGEENCWLTDEDIDRMENYVLARGIRGRKRWAVPWTFVMPQKPGAAERIQGEFFRMNHARECIVRAFLPLYEVFRGKNHTVAEQTYVFYRFIRSLDVEQQLKDRELCYRQQTRPGSQTKAQEYAQIYRIVMDLLDKVAALLGEEHMKIREYGDILDAGFEAAKVGTIPPGNDRVMIGDIERTRLNHIRVMFFVGVNDGIVPKAADQGSILSQFEREKLTEHDLPLAPGAREQVFIQKFYLYLNLTKPEEALYVTFSRRNADGKALRRSYLVGTLLHMFPDIRIREPEAPYGGESVLTPEGGMSFFLEGLAERRGELRESAASAERGRETPGETGSAGPAEDMTEPPGEAGSAGPAEDMTEPPGEAGNAGSAEGGPGAEVSAAERKEPGRTASWRALANWYLRNPRYRETAERMLLASFGTHTNEPVGRAVARALYGATPEGSVTRLERFAACAFSHYLDYGLRLRERSLQEFASVDMGNIYHDALEYFARQVEKSDYTWQDLPDELRDRWIEAGMEQAVAACQDAGIFEDAGNRYLLARMRQTVRRTVWALTVQVQKGQFVPRQFEVSFSQTDDLAAVRFTLGEEEQMRLRGRIDRVDTYETGGKVYVRIIDYKSGNTSFSLLNLYHGLQLQLMVYLNAALEMTEKKYPGKTAEPGGIFYYHVNDPMIEGSGTESEEEIRQAVLEKLKLNGLVNDDPEVIRAMDADAAGSSSVIPVGFKTDGSLKATSKTAATEQFRLMSDYVGKLITKEGRRMMDGDVSVQPYESAGRSGCDYCPYHMVCGFDPRIPGFSYRKLEQLPDADAVMERMREKVE